MIPPHGQAPRSPVDVRLATPAGWFDLDLDRRTRRRTHQRLARRRVGPSPQGAELRRQVVGELEAVAERAVSAGARFASVYSEVHDRLPVAATMVGLVRGRLQERSPDGQPDLPAAASALAAAFPDATTTLITLPAGPALRRRHRVSVARSGREKQTDNVEYIVPVPDGPTLVLEFSTPTLPVADAMAELFDAIAATLRWQR